MKVDRNPPTTSHGVWFTFLPTELVPYAQLARADKPGFIAVWVTLSMGVLEGAAVLRLPLGATCQLIVYTGLMSQAIMWFNFAWNDTCDARIDRAVPRTSNRPLARGAISITQALYFDGVLAALVATFLLPLRTTCSVYSIPMTMGCLIYPLTKRFTNYPQIFLGIVGQTGIFLGAAAAGVDAVPFPLKWSEVLQISSWYWPKGPEIGMLCFSYAAGVIWNIFFEVIYSYQDAEWDASAGIGTITRVFKSRKYAKAFLGFLAIAQTFLHLRAGSFVQPLSLSWMISVSATALSLGIQVWRVDLSRPESCMYWFKTGIIITGSSLLLGPLMRYLGNLVVER